MPRHNRRRQKNPNKATHDEVTLEFLAEREARAAGKGFAKAKWIEFCEAQIAKGRKVFLYEARQTVSKYVSVQSGGRWFKVRFSNHQPIKSREAANDCDFFVGVCNFQTTTTAQALAATDEFFGWQPAAPPIPDDLMVREFPSA